ncbi:unnamed protein product [Phytophthora fragariaefolia]|uniref:Unnamed protein product n=1 Tax=Phytophthora fragariaefolia TaxID=1490495 RepID=A0A9W6XD61_9STRA|nr:unnamed protein product [Phytophthora fragariaefolia]
MMLWLLLLPLLYHFSLGSTSAIDPSHSPVVALLPRHLVAFYPLLSDSRDYAPDGRVDGYSQDALPSSRSTSSSTSTANVAISQKFGLRLELGIGLDLPINVNSGSLPQLTVGGWVQVGAAMAGLHGCEINLAGDLCLLSQNGSSVGRSVCIDRGAWIVGGRRVDGVEVKLDEWAFVAAVFGDGISRFYVDGQMVGIDVVVKSVARQLLIVGAAAGLSLGGFSGYLKSLFVFDVALSETELEYLMTTEYVEPKSAGVLSPIPAPVVDLVKEADPIPLLYLKDRLDNSVSMRQVIDPDGDEYNVALPSIDDTKFLSVDLVYVDDNVADVKSAVANVSTTQFELWSLVPQNREVHVGTQVIVQGSPNFDGNFSVCRINGNVDVIPQTVTADSISCKIPELSIQGTTLELSISQNGIDFVSVGSLKFRNRPWFFRLAPSHVVRSILPQTVDVFGTDFVNTTYLNCLVGGVSYSAVFLSRSRIKCIVEPMRYDQELSLVAVAVSVNGVDYSDNFLELKIVNPPSVSALTPSNGPTAGGTTVAVSGQGFRQDTPYSITFQRISLNDLEFVSANQVLWTSTAVNSTGIADMMLAVDGVLFPEIASLQFTFTRTPQPRYVFPRLLPVHMEAVLTISGTNFGDFDGLRCAFIKYGSNRKMGELDTVTVPATYVTNTIIQCSAPNFLGAGSYGISVSNNAQDYSRMIDNVAVTVHDDVILERASVSSGPATGETVVQITGKNFIISPDVACKFGPTRARGCCLSSTKVQCISPAWQPTPANDGIARVPITIALNGLDFSNSSVTFQYFAPPVVNAISPSMIPINSSVSLALYGNYLISYGGVICRIGLTIQVPGIVVNGGRGVQCDAVYISSVAGIVDVSVSLNGGNDFSRSQSILTVHNPITLTGVDTPYVAKDLSSTIIVRGQSFLKSNEVVCAFGYFEQEIASATVITSDAVGCTVPPSLPGNRDYQLRVSLNNGTHFSHDIVHVYVYSMPNFLDALVVSKTKKTILQVTGSGFMVNGTSNLTIDCIFGSYGSAIARVENASSLSCLVPDIDTTGSINIPVSFFVGSSLLNTSLNFTYKSLLPAEIEDPGAIPGRIAPPIHTQTFNDHRLDVFFPTPVGLTKPHSNLEPEVGDISPEYVGQGLHANITVRGQNFRRNQTFCHFSGIFKTTPAIVLSTAFALCPFDASAVEPGIIGVSLKSNTIRPTFFAFSFSVLAVPTITSIYPRRGPLEGKTKVLLMGTGYIDHEMLYCHFDDEPRSLAARLADTMVQCITPSSKSGRLSKLKISIQSRIFSTNSVEYLYQDMPQLQAMFPSYGSVDGGTALVFKGRYLNSTEDLIFCSFGSSLVKAVVLNSTTAVAETPASTIGTGDVAVQCTLNGEVVSAGGLSYHYLLTPHVSYITPQMGLESANTTVLVEGNDFSETYPMTCIFGNVSSKATAISSSQVRCVAPPYRTGIVNVSVVFGSYSPRNSSVCFELHQVIPPLGPETGSTRLLITGDNFNSQVELHCAFSCGEDQLPIITSAFRVSKEGVICFTPPFRPGPVYIQIAVYDNLVEPQILSVTPRHTSGSGSVVVSITGVGFVNSDHLRCSMGTNIVRPVRFKTESQIICRFPRQLMSGALPVRVTNNNQDFTTDPILFVFYPSMIVEYVTPLNGLIDELSTRILIGGHKFHENTDLICGFNDHSSRETFVKAAFLSLSIFACSLPTPTGVFSLNSSMVMSKTVQVKEETQDEVLFEAQFLYFARPILLSMFPKLALSDGVQILMIEGSNFLLDIDIFCQFDSYYSYDLIPFTVMNSTHGSCSIPERSPGPVEVRLCLTDHNQCSHDSLTLSLVRRPVIRELLSRSGPGGAHVTVIGMHFYNVLMHCEFDGMKTLATFVNQTLVTCPSATVLQHKCSKFLFYVDGVNIVRDLMEYCTPIVPMLNLIRPATGPARGGTRVVVSGGPFRQDTAHNCNFGKVHIDAEYLSTTQIFCVSPPSQAFSVPFSISGRDFSTTGLTFSYHAAPIVTNITPNRGSEIGQYRVTINGSNFICGAGLRCQFGVSEVVAAKWISNSSISCTVPRHSPGWVDVQVTNNLQDYSEQGLRFEYVASPIVLGFEPKKVYFQADESIILHGRNFYNSSDIRCIIGNELTDTTFLSNTMLKCSRLMLVETSVLIGVFDLSLSMIGVFADERLIVLDYGIWSLSPRVTSTRGASPVILSRRSSDELFDYKEIYGRFCSQNRAFCSELVPAEYLKRNQFRWLSPPCNITYTSGLAEFFRVANVSVIPRSPIATFPYRYYREVVLTSLTPSVGAVSGGTTVTLSGMYFQDGHNLSCVINGAVFVRAHFITDTMISCTMPPLVSGSRSIGIFVSFNGLEISEASLDFTYVEVPSVISIFPAGGPINGETMVSVLGAHFVQTPKSVCRFGYTAVPATVISSTELTCLLQTLPWATIGYTEFRYSSNGQEFSRENVSFLFYENPSRIEINPRIGSVNGGTQLTLSWDNAAPEDYMGNVSCKIGLTDGNVVLGTRKSVVILVPPSRGGNEGPATTHISLNGQNYVEGPQFWYLVEPQISSISPNSSGETSTSWVQVYGTGFPRLVTVACRFGNSETVTESPAEWVSQALVICRAPVHRPAIVDFSFTLNGVDDIATLLKFQFTQKSVIPDFFPISGPTTGGTVLVIPVNSEVEQCRYLSCIVGGSKVIGLISTKEAEIKCLVPPNDKPGQVSVAVECDAMVIMEFQSRFMFYQQPVVGIGMPISSSEIRCVVPSFTSYAMYSIVELEVSPNRVDYTTSGSTLQLTPPLDVLDVSPKHGFTNQILEVLVTLSTTFIDLDHFSCRVGESSDVPAFAISRSSILCTLPPISSPGTVTMAVSNNGVDYVDNLDSRLYYHRTPKVLSLNRNSGSVFGGDIVVIDGLGFISGVQTVCCFDNTTVDGTYLNDTSISCHVPAWPWLAQGGQIADNANMSVKVQVGFLLGSSKVGMFDQAGDLYWMYRIPLRNVLVHPTAIISGLVTTMNVTGLEDLKSSYVMSVFDESRSEVAQTVPLYESNDVHGNYLEGNLLLTVPGLYTVVIEDSGGYVVYRPNVVIEVIKQITVLSIQPSSGPVRGGSFVVVEIDTTLDYSDDVMCLFGDYTVSISDIVAEKILCRAPPVTNPGEVRAGILFRGQTMKSRLAFNYYPDELIVSVFPEILVTSANNQTLMLVGMNFYHFDNKSTPLCQIGNVLSRAVILSSTKAACASVALNPGKYLVAIACDGINFISSAQFVTYISPIWIRAIQPSVVPISGGITLDVKGSSFPAEGSLKCNFGRGFLLSTAEVVSSTKLRCLTPGVGKHSHTLPVSVELEGSMSNELLLSFVAPSTIIAVTPNIGFSSGGTTVRIDVANAPHNGKTSCIFGDTRVTATRMTSTQIACKVPSHNPGVVQLAVKRNDTADIDGLTLPFTFLPDITIEKAYPSRGTAFGGTKIALTLSRPLDVSLQKLIMCRFGLISSEVVSFSDTQVVCISPLGRRNDQVSIAIVLNGEEVAEYPLPFKYVDSQELTDIDPRVVSIGGNVTLRVQLERVETRTGLAYQCGFESSTNAIVFSEGRIRLTGDVECTTVSPFPDLPGQVFVSLWQNGERYSSNTLSLRFISSPLITAVSPTTLPESGGALIRVMGSSFNSDSTFSCNFGDGSIVVSAIVISYYLLECISPPILPGNYSFGIAWNGQELAVSQQIFTVYESLSISYLKPMAGLRNQHTQIRVVGTGFLPSSDLCCRLENTLTPAAYVNHTEVICEVPPLSVNKNTSQYSVGVEVSLDGMTFVDSTASIFTFYAAPVIDRISPNLGGVLGGTRVLVHGSIDETLDYSCVFDKKYVVAVPLNSSTLFCFTPASNTSRRIQVHISVLDAFVETEFPLWFTYYASPFINSVFPSTARTIGGEDILVSGGNFFQTTALFCQFGNSIGIVAVFVSSTTIMCVAPPRVGTGYVVVEISLNGIDYTSSGQSLYYYDYIDILAVNPQRVSASGGSKLHLTLAAESAHVNASIDCVFVRPTHTMRRPAYFMTNTDVMCYTPIWTPGTTTVGIVLSRKLQFMADSTLEFVAEPWIDSIKPSHGPAGGGTLITVFGEFLANPAISCVFDEIEVSPSSITENQVSCIAPPSAESTENASVIGVSVAIATSISSNAIEYTYDMPIKISNVSIYKLPEDGGSMVTVSGLNFLNQSNLCCDFGSRIPTIKAEFIDVTKIRCPIRLTRPAQVKVGVSNNGYDFIYFEETVAYVSRPYIIEVYPTSGPVEGGTPVLLTLSNTDFIVDEDARLFCSFGDQDTQAFVTENNLIGCVSPGVTQSSAVSISFYWRSSNLEDRYDAESQVNFIFYYSVFPKLKDISPRSGSAAERTVMTLFGSGFREGMMVRFGSRDTGKEVDAIFVSESVSMADVPEQLVDGVISIAVTGNNVDYSNSLTFYVRPRPILHSVYPSEVSIRSTEKSVNLTIYGSGFIETTKETVKCRVGEAGTVNSVEWISETEISCPSPYLDAGPYAVYVALNGVDFVNDGLTVFYHEQFVVYNISPTFGVIGGNTRVRVFGSNFRGGTNESDLVCVFGNSPTPLVVINSSVAECVTPHHTNVGFVSFGVDHFVVINPRYKARDGVNFYYHKVPVVLKILPSVIRVSNASPLRIIGANFLDSLLLSCLIGGVRVIARFISSNIIECLLVDIQIRAWLPENTLNLEVSNNGQDFSNSELQLLIKSPIQLLRMEPAQGTVGQAIPVKIFRHSVAAMYTQIRCHVGETHVVLSSDSGEEWIECVMPASPFPATVQVSLSIDGIDYTADSLQFTYEDTPVVYSIYPESGPFEGGTIVNVYGEGFGSEKTLYCAFGSSYVQADVQTPLMATCYSPPYSTYSDQMVSVTVARAEILATMASKKSDMFFSYVKLPEILSIRPSESVVGDRTLITLETSGIQYSTNAWCKFGGTVVKAESIDPDLGYVRCVTPILPVGQYCVGVSTNERDFSDSLAGYSVLEVVASEKPIGSGFGHTLFGVPVIKSIVPSSGSILGGTNVTLNGQNFVSSPLLVCVFGAEESSANFVNDSSAWCISPPQDQPTTMYVRLKVFNPGTPGESFVSDSLAAFEYQRQLEFISMFPSEGPCTGGTELKLFVAGLVNSSSLSCAFTIDLPSQPEPMLVSVQAQYHSDDFLSCRTPSLGAALSASGIKWYENATGVAQVAISNNGVDFVVAGKTFYFTPLLSETSIVSVDLSTLKIMSAKPTIGPISGGTPVILVPAFAFPSTVVFCQFGGKVVRGTISPATNEVLCISPRVTAVGVVRLAIGADGMNFSVYAADFEYAADQSALLNLSPTNGVASGGTLLNIYGFQFDEDGNYSCKIGEQIVRAEVLNQTHLGCRTPPVSKPQNVLVKISDNGVDYSGFNLSFFYVDPLYVTRIYPVSGDVEGGQLVDVVGGNFTAGAENVMCRFGDTVTMAAVLSASTAQCRAPKLEAIGGSSIYATTARLQKGYGIAGAKVTVEMSSNGQDYSNSGVVYHYTPTPVVYSLQPNHGPLEGGTEVVVTGINFINSSSLRCKFGERVSVAATFLNTTQFTCVSPSGFDEGDVYVEVANHGLFGDSVFTNDKKIFTYDSSMVTASVFPPLGPTTGNFTVRITGGPFRKTDAVRCKFAEIVVVGTWTSYDEILCTGPPHTPGVFTLEVTRNAQDYTDTHIPFLYYAEQGIRSISPTFGPAYAAGTRIDVEGVAFVNSSLLSCRFGYVVTPGEYESPTKIRCTTPPLPEHSGGLMAAPLPEYQNQWVDPNVGSVYLFPDAHYYPHYFTRLVSVEVSNNQQDFSLSGVNFLYYEDETVEAIAPTQAFDSAEPLMIFAYGSNFINTTSLSCRLGLQVFSATFVTSKLLLCEVLHPMLYDDARRDSDKFHDLAQPRHTLFEVSNNGKDFTNSHIVFEFLGSCPTGFFCPKQLQGSNGKIPCPRGTYCPGVGNTAFTLCPRGTYQPKTAQLACLRCPIGYHCPHTGMHVPRLCPAGFVCDVTGIEEAEQPCPEGHFCLEGTATTATTCTPMPTHTGMLMASPSAAEKPTTLRRQRGKGRLASIQARKSGCWRNETDDFGLQLSDRPSRFWMELRQLPLTPGSSFGSPLRGRFCLDDSCVKLADADNVRVEDADFDYDSTNFALRRPVACPAGSYCHPGTAANDSLMKNFTTAQPCFESMYCPEGSSNPRGFGECAPGFYCPFGTRIPCPAGSYCPQAGHIAPLPCPPGTFNAMASQSNCTQCPVGFICPGYGRVMPALCPPGYVCSKTALASPNSLCPRGFYCLEGTATSDGFRNDTRLRPYPCRPGTYCLKGVVADEVRVGDYHYPQNCTAGFYCELGSYSPKGSGLCPPGFTCPSGTGAPIPTSKGTFAQLEGTVSAADCAPGYYAPTIESTECVPCPPGTSCENDRTAVASICPPGSYRGSLSADGLACLACPQGTWSKNWELRGVEECLECAPGTVCPIDGISNPCTVDDLPYVYTPVTTNLTFAQCLERGSHYFFGVLLEPWIDELGRGAHFLPDRDNGRCYMNSQPLGSDLYQRFANFHGPLYEISTGAGVPHQGYGDNAQYPAPNMFARGSLAIDLPVSRAYDVARNCTPGFFYKKQWYPGTCEADIFCSASVWSKMTAVDQLVAQAQPCPEGYVCDLSTTADTAFSHPCPAGYVCASGTTPDLTLDSPRGQLRELCPAGKYCAAGTAESQKERYICPVGYFCPTGTVNPFFGEIANDALRRRLSSEDSNPFMYMNYTKYVDEGDIRIVSSHDMHCFDGVDDDLVEIFRLRQNPNNENKTIVVNRAEERNRLCARDHKWRTVELALRRNECDCVAQTKVVKRVFRLWKCTVIPSTTKPTVYDPERFGWSQVHNSATQCSFTGTHGSNTVDLAPLVAGGGSGVRFQTGWTETTAVHSYAELRTLIDTKYAEQLLPVDPYLYDLHHAIELIEAFGEETPEFAGFVSGASEDSDDDLIRLDACACSQMFKCPNGTTSVAGSDDIYDCVKTGTEVLQRVSPIPLTSDRLFNGSDFQDLTGISGYGLGSIVLEPYEVAVITINTTQLERNLTYGAHYQISIYQDCKPCPPQYKCDLTNDPPDCTYPDDDNTTVTRLYEKCMDTYDGDTFICNNMPFYCERRTLPLAEVSRSAAESGSNETVNIAGCCSCERQQMPYYFEDAAIMDRGFPDNKHGYIQFSIAALEEAEVTVALELVHGLYVRDFVGGFTQDRFDLTVFTPGRADYSPEMPSTNTFLAFLQEADMDNLMLPLNLPEQYVRVAGTLTYNQQVATTLLINRMSDIFVGDPQLPSKRGYIRNTEQNSVGALISVTDTNSSSNGSADSDAVVVPPTDYFGLYAVPDPLENMLRSNSWWTQELGGVEFLALPYLPYFSSCRGFDSNIFLFKMLETHPDCTFVGYDQTIEVDQYPWRKKLTPNADRCLIEYTAEVAATTSLFSTISSAASTLTSSSSSDTSKASTTFKTFTRGVSLSCLYEENLEGGAEKLRWYEAPKGTVLFYITRDPAAADSFIAEGDITTTGTGWGRSDTFQNYLGTDALIPVKGENLLYSGFS